MELISTQYLTQIPIGDNSRRLQPCCLQTHQKLIINPVLKFGIKGWQRDECGPSI